MKVVRRIVFIFVFLNIIIVRGIRTLTQKISITVLIFGIERLKVLKITQDKQMKKEVLFRRQPISKIKV